MTNALRALGCVLFLGTLHAPDASADATGSARIRTGDLVLEITLAELVGPEAAGRVGAVIARDEAVQWQAFVPPDYDASKPPGLLVYISPTQSGEVPRGWKKVLDRHNLIWLAANRSGNQELVARRILLATLATALAGRYYEIDEERIYISGLSGGGKTASMVATDYPHLFKGAIYNCGVELWDVETPKYIDQLRRNRFVFVTGTRDQALEPTKRVFRAYRDAGIENSKLMIVRNMSHRNPGSYDFEEALEYLDAGLAAGASPAADPPGDDAQDNQLKEPFSRDQGVSEVRSRSGTKKGHCEVPL